MSPEVERNAPPNPPALILQVLVSKTETGYAAHCLQMDIVTEGRSVEQVMDDIADLIRVQYQYARDTNNLASVFVPAPAEEFQKLAHAKVIGAPRHLDLSGPSEHAEDPPSYAIQELEVTHA
jgi:hypothetical protein